MKEHNKDKRLWIILGITFLSLAYQVFSNYAIYGNEIKHLWQTCNEMKESLKRIEEFLWMH